MRTEVQPAKAALKMSSVVQVFALALGIAALSEWLGPLPIALGVGKVVLLPMIWALLMGVLVSGQRFRPLPVDLQHTANAIMAVAVLVLCGRLALALGQQIPELLGAGPALLLQELGNVFGSLLLALRQEHAKAGKALVVHADGMLTCVCADEVLDYRVGAGAVDFGWALWLPLVVLVDAQEGTRERVRQRLMLVRTNTPSRQWRALRIWLRHKSALLRGD